MIKVLLLLVIIAAFVGAETRRRCCPTRRGPSTHMAVSTTPQPSSAITCNGDSFDVPGTSTTFGPTVTSGVSAIICVTGSLVFKYTCGPGGFSPSVECVLQKRDLEKRFLLQVRQVGEVGQTSGCVSDPIPSISNGAVTFDDPTPQGQESVIECAPGSQLQVQLKCGSDGFTLEPSCSSR